MNTQLAAAGGAPPASIVPSGAPPVPIAPDGGFNLPGILGRPDQYFTEGGTGGRLATVISTIIGVLTAVAFIWFVFLLFMGAIQYLTSGGDPKGIEAATAKIRTALIGLVVVISAIFFIQLIGTVLGLDILNIQSVFVSLVRIGTASSK